MQHCITRLLAIDPGANTGWALFDSGKLILSGDALPSPSWCAPSEIVIEMPVVYSSRLMKGNPNDIVKLAFRAGLAAGMYNLPPEKIFTALPGTWKGQIPKSIHHSRIEKILTPEELKLMPPKKEHDVWDAVALGLWYLKRCGRGGT